MTDPTSYPVRLADEVARQIGQLAEHLTQAPPRQAAQILGRAIECDEGILGRLIELMATVSHVAEVQARAGSWPPEIPLALARAANELYDLGLNLDEHTDDLRRLAKPPTAAGGTVPAPVARDMVVRRRR